MKTIQLKLVKSHVELAARITGNSFGDQLIEYIFEALDGTKLHAYSYHSEGEHLQTNEQMINEFDGLKKFDHSRKDV